MAIIATVLAWYIAGVLSFIFWWTKDHDFTRDEIGLATMVGLMGPFMFFVGWVVHGERKPKHRNRVIIPKRG